MTLRTRQKTFQSRVVSPRTILLRLLSVTVFTLAVVGAFVAPHMPGETRVALADDAMMAGEEDDDEDSSADKGASSKGKSGKSKYETKAETPLVADYTNFAGLSPVPLDGVALVVGLNGTGGDPAPSQYRTMLLEDLKKRGVPKPNQLLARPDTALVVVKAFLPPLLKKGETLDVEVLIPDSSNATSLAGGWMMETTLSEQAFLPGRVLMGHSFVKASGPILTTSVTNNNSKNEEDALLKRGRVLGGGIVSRERELAVFMKSEYSDVRNSGRVAEVIGKRFHDFDKHGIKEPMAKAKDNKKIVLKVHPRYKDNYPRYLQVVRHIAFREDAVGLRLRMQKLAKNLQIPDRSERAALELEAIGNDAIPVLKAGLKAPVLECRFHAAIALAYLSDSSGLEVLKETARSEPSFRVFSLAAMSTLDDGESNLALRELMSESSAETRYGAFRCMWTVDRNDPFIRGIPLRDGQFKLHVLPTEGAPMVHVTLHTRPEVVVFGAKQEFNSPMYVTAGRKIMVTASPGSRTVSLARFEPGEPDQKKEVSLNVAEVIHAAAELGANYPDIVQMLVEADRQQNLPGKLMRDALPQSGRVYERPDMMAGNTKFRKKSRIGRENLVPNLFPVDLDAGVGESGSERLRKDRLDVMDSADRALGSIVDVNEDVETEGAAAASSVDPAAENGKSKAAPSDNDTAAPKSAAKTGLFGKKTSKGEPGQDSAGDADSQELFVKDKSPLGSFWSGFGKKEKK